MFKHSRTKISGHFRTRSPERDLSNDKAKVDRIVDTLRSVMDELEAERLGLEQRYQDAQRRASEILGALNGENDLDGFDPPLGDMEAEIVSSERRIRQIDDLLTHLDSCSLAITAYR